MAFMDVNVFSQSLRSAQTGEGWYLFSDVTVGDQALSDRIVRYANIGALATGTAATWTFQQHQQLFI